MDDDVIGHVDFAVGENASEEGSIEMIAIAQQVRHNNDVDDVAIRVVDDVDEREDIILSRLFERKL